MTYEEKAWGMYLFSAGSLHSTLSLCVGCFITLLEEIIYKVFKKVFFRVLSILLTLGRYQPAQSSTSNQLLLGSYQVVIICGCQTVSRFEETTP